MATYGFRSWTGWGALWFIVAVESGLAVAVTAGSQGAALLAAGLMAILAATQVSALLRRRAGAPCACFGGFSSLGPGSVVASVALGAGFAALGLA